MNTIEWGLLTVMEKFFTLIGEGKLAIHSVHLRMEGQFVRHLTASHILKDFER